MAKKDETLAIKIKEELLRIGIYMPVSFVYMILRKQKRIKK